MEGARRSGANRCAHMCDLSSSFFLFLGFRVYRLTCSARGTVASLGSGIRKKVRGFWAVGYSSWQWGTWTGSERGGWCAWQCCSFGWAGSEQGVGCMRGGVGGELVKRDFVVRAAGKSRAHKVRDERGRLFEEAAERGGLEGLGKKGEESGVQSTEGGEVGEGAAEDHVRLVLDLAAGAEAAHALRALEAHARGAAPRRRRGRDALLR